MKILLVEDSPDAPRTARPALEGLGHQVITAVNGTAALELFRQERPDLVITDIYVAGMDGFALTRAILAEAAPDWQPVLFLTEHDDEALHVQALQVGAERYLVKPISPPLLEARLRAVQRLLELHRQAQARLHALEHHLDSGAEARRIARRLTEQLVDAGKLDDPALRHWLGTAENFSGDLVAAARTPAGVLHVLAADGTGQGMTAPLGVAPVLAPFYSMTAKGFAIDAIARELNARIRAFLPGDRCVATTLAAIDFRRGTAGVWNGGNPEPVLFGPHPGEEQTLSLAHAPLGVLADAEFDASLELHAFADGSQLFFYSDGLIKAENPQGEAFGNERFALNLVNAAPAVRFDAVVDSVTAHLSGRAPGDDILLVAVDCGRSFDRPPRPLPLRAPLPAGAAGWRCSLRLFAREILHVDAVPVLLDLAGQVAATREGSDRLFVVLAELYRNAVDYGLLRLDARLKDGPAGMEAYLAERQRRLAALTEGEVELVLEQLDERGQHWLRVSCRDSGPGFASAGQAAAADAGHGLRLLQVLCADLQFNAPGNQVIALLGPLAQSPSLP